MQRVQCTKCGKDSPALCRWCPGCGQEFRPLLLNSQPPTGGALTCPVCGTVNAPGSLACRNCGTVLHSGAEAPIGGSETGPRRQGGRVPLPSAETPDNSAGGGSRLSRLAQARRAKEAAEGKSGSDSGADWFGSLRSDAPPPADYATRMDEDDESDPNLSAALRQVRAEEDEDLAIGIDSTPPVPGWNPSSPAVERPPLPSFGFDSLSSPTPASPPPAAPSFGSAAGSAAGSFGSSSTASSSDSSGSGFNFPDLDSLLAESATLSEQEANPNLGDIGEDTSIPDWLSNQATPTPPPPVNVAPPAPSGNFSDSGDNVPDWLRNLTTTDSLPPLPVQAAEPAPRVGQQPDETGELPDWLKNAKSNNSYRETPPLEFSSRTETGTADIPEWLRRSTDSLPADTRPSFGDVDVEQRLNFAFDETTDPGEQLPTVNHIDPIPVQRGHTGLTDLLGLPPLSAADEAEAAAGSFDLGGLPAFPESNAPSFGTSAGSGSFDFGNLPAFPESNAGSFDPASLPAFPEDNIGGYGAPSAGSSSFDFGSLPAFPETSEPSSGTSAGSGSFDFDSLPAFPETNSESFSMGAIPTFPETSIGSGTFDFGNLPAFPDSNASSFDTGASSGTFDFGSLPAFPETSEPSFNTGASSGTFDFGNLPAFPEASAGSDSFNIGDLPAFPDTNASSFDTGASSGSFDFGNLPAFPDSNASSFGTASDSFGMGDLPAFPDSAAVPGDLPALPDFLLDSSAQSANSAALAPWLQGLELPTLEPAQPAIAYDTFSSTSFPELDSASSATGLPELPALGDLMPWEEAALPADNAFPAEAPATLVPWLQGLEPPTLESAHGMEDSFGLPDLLLSDDPTNENPPIRDDITDTRSFSARDMFRSTDALGLGLGASLASQAEASPVESNSAEGTGELPSWLRDMTAAEPSTPAPLNLAPAGPMAPLVLPPLPGDEEPEETEPVPFVMPSFEGPVAPPNPTTLASVSGGQPVDFELPDFLSESSHEAASEAPPAAPVQPEVPLSLREMPSFLTGDLPFRTKADPVLPDFLSGLSADASTPSRPLPPIVEDNSLDFLREEAAQVAPDVPEEAEIPPWLQAMAQGQLQTPPPKTTSSYSPMGMGVSRAEEQQAELPEWLRTEGASAAEPVSIPTPDFVQEAALPVAESVQPLPPAASSPMTPEVNQFLSSLGSGNTTDGLSPSRLPEWLQDSSQPANPEILEFNIPGTGELPEWLNERDSASAAPLPQTGPISPPAPAFDNMLDDLGGATPGFANASFLGDVEGPAWLRNSLQSKQPETGPARPTELPNSGTGPHTVPSWLRSMAPTATVEEETQPISFENFGVTSDAATDLPQVALPPQLASAAVLATLLTPAAAGAVITRKRTTALPMNLKVEQALRYGLSILLLAVALLGLMANPLSVQPVAITPEVQNVYNQIDSLTSDSKVLISYDWEADRYGEMRPLAQTLTAHVMAKRAQIATFSLNPQGPALADQVLNELTDNEEYGNSSFYHYGLNYLNMGWRSGQEVALRSLNGDLGTLNDYRNGAPVTSSQVLNGINSISDFNLIIVLAGDEGSVRAWVEQVGIAPGSQMILATPAAIEPLARPYAIVPNADTTLEANTQVRARGLIAGLSGAAQYDQLLFDQLNVHGASGLDIDRRLSAQTLAALLLIVVVIVANGVYLARRRQ